MVVRPVMGHSREWGCVGGEAEEVESCLVSDLFDHCHPLRGSRDSSLATSPALCSCSIRSLSPLKGSLESSEITGDKLDQYRVRHPISLIAY